MTEVMRTPPRWWRAGVLGGPMCQAGRRHSQRSCMALILRAIISGTQEPAAIGGWDKRRPALPSRLRRRWPL